MMTVHEAAAQYLRGGGKVPAPGQVEATAAHLLEGVERAIDAAAWPLAGAVVCGVDGCDTWLDPIWCQWLIVFTPGLDVVPCCPTCAGLAALDTLDPVVMFSLDVERHDIDGDRCGRCGNTSDSDGFYPCDIRGRDIEPTINSAWTGVYRCGRCDSLHRFD